MKPSEIIKKLQSKGVSSAEIAKRAGCSVFYVNKIASGERENPSYQIVDRLRALYAERDSIISRMTARKDGQEGV